MTGDRPDDRPPMTGDRPARPLLERVLLMLVALAMAAGFFVMGVASWVSGELPLGIFGLLGCFMTLWVGLLTLRRG